MARTKITLEYCGMTGEGETVAKAKQDAARKIEHALALDYTPRLITCGRYAYTLTQSPIGGVTAAMIVDDGQVRSGWSLCYCQYNQPMADVAESMAMHMATMSADAPGERPEITGFTPRKDFWQEFDRRMEQYVALKAERLAATA